MRPVVRTEEAARKELDPRRPRVRRLKRETSLPFYGLHGDQFEELCSRLLKHERPEEQIVLRGATGDAGYDIACIRRDGSVELIQCKCYQGSVSVGEVRKALAKIFVNLRSGEIPFQANRVARISFYVATNLSPQAENLLYQEKWKGAAKEALSEFLKKEPPRELLEFALSWWPGEGTGVEIGAHLSDRVKQFPELWSDFFEPELSRADLEVAFERALDSREVQVKGNEPTDRTWESFFDEVEQGNASYGYLEDWPGLTPNQRFVPPREYPEILEALRTQPVTFLIGPPAAGKTFVVLQMLWDAYKQGRQILWIAPETFKPTDGPIPPAEGLPDMKERIKALTHRLGIRPRKAPLDHHEFIAANLEPNSLVYIEDPFGKRDDEFEYSLHTYSFFDLDEFIRAINGSAAREGCRIVISSREGLFDHWFDERQGRGLPTPSALFRLSGESFGHEQLENLVVRLARAKSFNSPEEIASEIAYRVRYPYEVESILRGLPLDAAPERVEAEVVKYRNGLKEALRKTLVAETDQEVLFLVILASGCIDPKTWYLRLYEILGLPGEAQSSLKASIGRYRAFVIRRPSHARSGFMKHFGPDADEVFSPSHPIVAEAISEYLKSCAPRILPLLDRLGSVLSTSSEDRRSASRLASLALYLLSLGIGSQAATAQDSIATILFDRGGLSRDRVRSFMRVLPSLDETFKKKLFASFKLEKSKAQKDRHARSVLDDSESHKASLLVEMASALPLVEVPAKDAWRVLCLLLQSRDLMMRSSGRGMYTWAHPWRYLILHMEEAPPGLLSALETIASREPDLLVYMMAEVLVEGWQVIPEACKAVFFAETALEIPGVQEKALSGIARYWENAPEELRELFLRQAKHTNPRVRSEAASAALIYCRKGMAALEQILIDVARDSDVGVPLGILHLLGNEDSDRRFARTLFERADSSLATEMLYDLLRPSPEALAEWKLDLVRDCVAKGGGRADSHLALFHYRGMNEKDTGSVREWRASIADEPDPVRLGALWAYGSSNGKNPALEPDEAIALIEDLRYPYRSLALAYLTAHSKHLPQSVREYIENLESVQGNDGEAVRMGKKHQGTIEANNPWYFLPLIEQEKTEELASTEHPS